MNEESKCSRPQWWCELTEEEKTERMRAVVRDLQRASQKIYELESLLKRHIHSDGVVCLPVINIHGEPCFRMADSEDVSKGEVYF